MMKICFITKSDINAVWQEQLNELSDQDLIVFGFNGMGLVSYKKELNGETEYFSDLSGLSKQTKSVIISGCDTDTYGVFRQSAVIADNGKILGVSDMVHSVDDSEFVSGGSFRVYDTSAGKIGVLIMEDLYFPESSRVLTLCDADVIICLFKKIEGSIPEIMLRASAYSNGINIALIGKSFLSVCDIKGKILLSGRNNIIKAQVKIEKDYHLISSRRRGLYRDFNSGY